MMKYLSGMMLLAFVFSIQSCSVEGSSSGSGGGKDFLGGGGGKQSSYSDSYEFSLNGCHTGKHNFSNASENETRRLLCEALMDDERNKYCAKTMRTKLFEQKCKAASVVPADPQKPGSPNMVCIEFVGGSYASTEQRALAAQACRGVVDMDAVRFVAGSYGAFERREAAARACQGNISFPCLEFVAGSYGSYEEKLQSANVCHGVDMACLKHVAGNYSNFDQRVIAARSCGGN